MKITNLVEEIFAQAVALDQSGGLRNTIYAMGNEIFIMNYDHTVLLRFQLRATETKFAEPISFKANDYDSNTFEEKDGKIIFTSEKDEYVRNKTIGTTDLTPVEVRALYRQYITGMPDRSQVNLSRSVVELLDEDLSHIEFRGDAGDTIVLTQRNIYSGGIIEITKNSDRLFKEELAEDFGPVAIKTNDFISMFAFQDTLKFSFPTRGHEDFILITSVDTSKTSKRNMTAIVACCLYDEIINLKEAKPDGRQEQKIRRRK